MGATDLDEFWNPVHECVGHNPADLQPFHGMFPSWDAETSGGAGQTASKRYYSNAELYELLRPTASVLPYVYDNFAWPHCSVRAMYV